VEEKYPNSILDEQRVCSPLNSIIRRRVFSADELEDLKREVRQELTYKTHKSKTRRIDQRVKLMKLQRQMELGMFRQTPNSQMLIPYTEAEKCFETVKLCFQGMPLGIRPRISKVQCKITVYELVSLLDQVLASEVRNTDNLVELAGLVHCAALATCQVLGCKVRTRNETNATQQKNE
jgi:hypothetical protein